MSDDARVTDLAQRLAAVGISKSEFAERAGVDRGTLGKALSNDDRVTVMTWTKIKRALIGLEDELGMAESGNLVTTTVEVNGAKVTVKGRPSEVAATVRQMLA